MFRHERPQKGRFRQFYQINAELFNDSGPRSDADLIIMALTFFNRVRLTGLNLNINSLGCPECREKFRKKLEKYLSGCSEMLCPDCVRRSITNPLRVFDCKVQGCQEVVSDAPSILDFICRDCSDHFETLQGYLLKADIEFEINPKLVRGLDYYSRTTFEIQTDRLGSQNAVAGGGRYDGLVRQLGGPDHPAIGFAVGIERLVALLEEIHEGISDAPELYIACIGGRAEEKAFRWVNELRFHDIWVEMEYVSKGLKPQMKTADRLGAGKVLIVGDNELEAGKGILRDMETKEQEDIPLDNLVENIRKKIYK
jgi:histidyl-tRNA synthetase